MKQTTIETAREIMKWVVSQPIPLTWRSNTVMPSAGERRSRSRGSSGFDLATRNIYEPGDDPRDIDWFATAQTGGQHIYTVQYYDPRDTKFFVVVDAGATMDFGTVRTTKRYLAAELAGSIIKSAEETGDRVGAVVFSDNKIDQYLPPKAASQRLFTTIASIVDAGDKAGKAPAGSTMSGFSQALKSVAKHSRSLVFVLSDFMNMGTEEKKMLKRLAVLHDVVCIAIQDLRERELPGGFGLYTFQDLRTGEKRTIWLTRKNRELFQENFQKHQSELFEFFREAHCDWEIVSTEEGIAAHPKLLKLFAGHRR